MKKIKYNTALTKAIKANFTKLLNGRVMVLQDTNYTSSPLLVMCTENREIVVTALYLGCLSGVVLAAENPPSYRRLGFVDRKDGMFDVSAVRYLCAKKGVKF